MGCCSCTVKCQKILVFGFGGCLLVIGLFIGGFMNMIVDSILTSQLVLSEGSLTYNNWIDLPVPMYLEFHFFNVTNAEEFEKDPTIKPILKEKGPYVYREFHGRNIMAWNDDNSTITFQNIRTWQFDEESSAGPEDDIFVTINSPAATVNYMARLMGTVERLIMSSLLRVTGEGMFVTRSVKELIFQGYWDPILNATSQLNTSLNIPFKEFGYFIDRNNSASYDGVFNMYTGASNIDLLGQVARWNYRDDSPYYDPPCNEISGSTGELWAPLKNKNDVGIFTPDFCLTLKMNYGFEAELYGVDGYGYYMRDDMLNSSDPESQCLSLPDADDVPPGIVNVSACRYNAPVFVSRPHFLYSDPSLLDAVEGLDPDPAKHNITLGLEPMTGVPLYVNARLMLSVMIEHVEHVSLYEKVPERLYFPVFWFSQRAVLSEDLATLAKWVKRVPAIGMGIFFGLAGIGALLLFIGIMLTVRHGWRGSDRDILIQK